MSRVRSIIQIFMVEAALILYIACLDSLTYREMDYRQQEIENAPDDSSSWIFDHKSYKTWLEQGYGLLWIKGKPGSGKSTLMKKIFKNYETEQHVRLAFFFHRRGNTLQQSLIGMFRTMLHQLLSQVPLVGTEFQHLWEKKKKWEATPERDWEWRVEELREVFSSALLAAAKNYTIIIFVDALDEAGDAQAHKTVFYFHELNERLFKVKARASICFSCRHFPIFSVKNTLEVCVEDENHEDIKNYVLVELERSLHTNELEVDSNKPVNILQEQIVEKASGIFLWVVLMVPMIARKYNHGESLNTILGTLAEMPSDLVEISKHILKKVLDPNDKPRTLRLMQWRRSG